MGAMSFTITGWYGLSSVFIIICITDDKKTKHVTQHLKQMLSHGRYLKTLMATFDMVIAKTDLTVAKTFTLKMLSDVQLRESIFCAHRGRNNLTCRCGLKICYKTLEWAAGAAIPNLADSIRNDFRIWTEIELFYRWDDQRRIAQETPKRQTENLAIYWPINGVGAVLRNTVIVLLVSVSHG